MGSPERSVRARYFVGIGVGEYDDPELDLPRALADIHDVGEWFATSGGGAHVRAADVLAANPRWSDIQEGLIGFFDDRGPEDAVVVWFACHGDLDGVEPFLFGRNTPATAFAGRAVHPTTIGQIIGRSRAHDVLVIIDACVAGRLARSIQSAAEEMADAQRTRDPHRPHAQAVIASAYGRNPAHDGRFAEAFLRVVNDERWTGTTSAWLSINQLMEGLATELRDISPTQVADRRVWGTGPEQLIPNPHHRSRRLVGLIADHEFAAHFDPASRGVAPGESGSYFVGRRDELARISRWLTDPPASGMLVITGSPGTGKSAVLARTVVLSAAGTTDAEGPPADVFSGVVWCHGKTPLAVIEELGRILGGPAGDPESLLRIAEDKQCILAIDALDETAAGGATYLAEQVLRPLASHDGIRLLIATRRHPVRGAELRTSLIDQLGAGPDDVIDLDLSPSGRGDMFDYVTARLAAADHLPGASADLAQKIVEAAYPSFLVAAIAARTALLAPPRPGEPYALPRDVGQALAGYIDQLPDPVRARALLRPLAWARGIGLPWGVLWPSLATRLHRAVTGDHDTPPITAAEVAELLDTAGDLIVETNDAGQPRYRLFHEALAEHLREDLAAEGAHDAIGTAMLDLVHRRPWIDVDPYVVAHLPHHLTEAHRVDEALDILLDPRWDRARRRQAGHPLAAAEDAGRTIESMLSADPTDIRIVPLAQCHSRVMTSATPLVIEVIARSGQLARAAIMANNLLLASDRMIAYAGLADAFAEAGRPDLAERAVTEVQRAVQALPDEHQPLGHHWIARAATAAGLSDRVGEAARQAVAAIDTMSDDPWDVPNGLFWAGATARLAKDHELIYQIRNRIDALPEQARLRNQTLQAAAVSGHKSFLADRAQDYARGYGWPTSMLRPGNLALALVDAGMLHEATSVFDQPTDQPPQADAIKRWAWALALAGRREEALAAVDALYDEVEKAKALARLTEIAVQRDDRAMIEALTTRLDHTQGYGPRGRARLIRAMWQVGRQAEATAAAEQEATSQGVEFLADPREGEAIAVARHRRTKTTRREMVSSQVPDAEAGRVWDVQRLLHEGRLDDAVTTASTLTIPIHRARALASVATKQPGADAVALWMRAVADARLAGRGAVQEILDQARADLARLGLLDTYLAMAEAAASTEARWEVESFSEQYTALRRALPSGTERTRRMHSLLEVPRRLARTQPFTKETITEAWETGDDGRRLFALAVIEAAPRLAVTSVLIEGICKPRSAFEQYEALQATSRCDFTGKDAAQIREAILAQLEASEPDGKFWPLAQDSSRRIVAQQILGRM